MFATKNDVKKMQDIGVLKKDLQLPTAPAAGSSAGKPNPGGMISVGKTGGDNDMPEPERMTIVVPRPAPAGGPPPPPPPMKMPPGMKGKLPPPPPGGLPPPPKIALPSAS